MKGHTPEGWRGIRVGVRGIILMLRLCLMELGNKVVHGEKAGGGLPETGTWTPTRDCCKESALYTIR